ncbi:MAG TPA: RNA-binding protein [Candidatus Saccharimonadales bacterium]
MSMKLYVGKLSYDTTDQTLEELFAKHGKVLSVAVIKDRDSGQSKGFGFVEMEDVSGAQAAIKDLNGKQVDGRAIVVNQARPQASRPAGAYR